MADAKGACQCTPRAPQQVECALAQATEFARDSVPTGVGLVPLCGTSIFIYLRVADTAAAIDFYVRAFGGRELFRLVEPHVPDCDAVVNQAVAAAPS